MGYHKRKINKGVVGEYTKIIEEFEEFLDAVEQDDKVLQICELTDIIGAIEAYTTSKFNLTLNDLISFSNKTRQAFKDGKR